MESLSLLDTPTTTLSSQAHSFQCKYHGLYTLNAGSFLEVDHQNLFQIRQQGLQYALKKYVCDISFLKQCFII